MRSAGLLPPRIAGHQRRRKRPGAIQSFAARFGNHRTAGPRAAPPRIRHRNPL